jgi:hypothetical protein
VNDSTARRWFRDGGGMAPLELTEPEGRYLSLSEREEIAIGLAQQLSYREIGRRIGRAASTVSREVRLNGPRRPGRPYRARRRSPTGASPRRPTDRRPRGQPVPLHAAPQSFPFPAAQCRLDVGRLQSGTPDVGCGEGAPLASSGFSEHWMHAVDLGRGGAVGVWVSRICGRRGLLAQPRCSWLTVCGEPGATVTRSPDPVDRLPGMIGGCLRPN